MCLGSKIFIIERVTNISIASYLILIWYIHFQGIFIEKKSNLYIKISLIEKKKEFSSKKVWCSNNKTTIDFSKEIMLNLHDRDARNCSLLFQLKKYSGLGSRSRCNIFVKHWLCNLCQAWRSASWCWGARVTRAATTAPCCTNLETGSLSGTMQSASDPPTHTSLSKLYIHMKLSLFIHP